MVDVFLPRAAFGETEHTFLDTGDVVVSVFRYDTGVEAVRLANRRGWLVILPYLGQMLWEGSFDGVALGMGHRYSAPRPADNIAGTYGCLSFHAGLLSNGNPSSEDNHKLHGEFPCARLQSAGLEIESDDRGSIVRLVGEYEHIYGFSTHYAAHPSLTFRGDSTLFDISMHVDNLSSAAMDLMYNCHINFDFVHGGRIVQPASFSPAHVTVRRPADSAVGVPPEYRSLVDELAVDPSRSAVLDPSSMAFNPDLVFYLSGLRCDPSGRTHVMLRRPDKDGFAVSFSLDELPHPIRWLLNNSNARAAGIALPATCRPNGYATEKKAGRVRTIEPGAQADFNVSLGYLDRLAADAFETMITML